MPSQHHSVWKHVQFLGETVLGLNRRNSHYIFSLNPQELIPIVDDKVRTKEELQQHAIACPATYGVVRSSAELRYLAACTAGHDAFVVKPCRGSGGGGILVCEQSQPGQFTQPSGAVWNTRRLVRHVDEILSGVFALDERADAALFEYRIVLDPRLRSLSPFGIPDIRFLVVMGVPLLAMLRLPTKKSGGRANLHAGGVGVGVAFDQGITRRGLFHHHRIRRHPDTQLNLAGVQLLHWQEMLVMAARCYDAVPLGYMGVDMVIDETSGPMVLELNARPGLQIQLANDIGLRPFLERVLAQRNPHMSVHDRIQLGQEIYQRTWPQFMDE